MTGKDTFSLGIFAVLTLAAVSPAPGQSLNGSRSSLDVQNRIARDHEFTYLSTASQVKKFVASGYLVPVRPNRDFDLHAVSFPYARPEVETFIRRLAAQYHDGCGEKLVVTSLTRPQSQQPRNASARSVHPTGMAIDLRRSNSARCRTWLEGVLLSLEKSGILEATRERYPPHYHVAVFPRPYARYVARMEPDDGRSQVRVASSGGAMGVTSASQRGPSDGSEGPSGPVETSGSAPAGVTKYYVRPGDSLWTIARRHGTTVERLRDENALRGSRIYAGQVIEVPVTR